MLGVGMIKVLCIASLNRKVAGRVHSIAQHVPELLGCLHPWRHAEPEPDDRDRLSAAPRPLELIAQAVDGACRVDEPVPQHSSRTKGLRHRGYLVASSASSALLTASSKRRRSSLSDSLPAAVPSPPSSSGARARSPA